MSTLTLVLRPATPLDCAAAYGLIELLFEHEKLPLKLKLTQQHLHQAWFEVPTMGYAWLATVPSPSTLNQDVAIGLLHYSLRLATFTGQAVLHIEDVVVNPAYRGHGVGRALLTQAHTIATNMGANRITLDVGDANDLAQAFYKKLGFSPLTGATTTAYSTWGIRLSEPL